MKLGEKLQQLRKKSGLSQEQLAARLTVSRQAVSKWELDETAPDTENVIQLSRLFGVSCDYLLRDEVEEPGGISDAPAPAAPGETHLTQQGWTRSATILSLTICAMGLLLAIDGGLYSTSAVPTIIAVAIQLGGILIFELAVPHMGGHKAMARMEFYAIACWLVLFIPLPLLVRGFLSLSGWSYRPRYLFFFCALFYVLLNVSVTTALLVLRRRQRAKA